MQSGNIHHCTETPRTDRSTCFDRHLDASATALQARAFKRYLRMTLVAVTMSVVLSGCGVFCGGAGGSGGGFAGGCATGMRF
jgi:hypothetical protein